MTINHAKKRLHSIAESACYDLEMSAENETAILDGISAGSVIAIDWKPEESALTIHLADGTKIKAAAESVCDNLHVYLCESNRWRFFDEYEIADRIDSLTCSRR